jgi:hypothetical protein
MIEIGRGFISTGNPKRKHFFITPTGIFRHSIQNFGYRAEGTENEFGWRGLGRKSRRVWDFGWQETEEIKQGSKQKRIIRLLLHATDPDYGEPRLGKPDSQGCVRISGDLNDFLDHFGILDKDYESNKHLPEVQWLLKRKENDRQVVAHPGECLLIGDSQEF